MIVKIHTSGNSYHFNLIESRYASFAHVILEGYTNWIVDVSSVDVSQPSGNALDTSFVLNAWIDISSKVLAYLQLVIEQGKLEQVFVALRASSNPGEALEKVVC